MTPPPDDTSTLYDEDQMEAFLGKVLDRYRNGSLSRTNAIGVLAHIIAAAENREISELRNWFADPEGVLANEK